MRVATHCTEADVSEQHIALSRKLGLDTVGFLMMAHMNDARGARTPRRSSWRATARTASTCTDSAGYMLPDDVTARVAALRAALRPETEIGFHGHHNLAMGIANSLAAVEAGASRIDGSAAGLGAGAGNTPLEVFNAVCRSHGHRDGRRRVQAHGRRRGPGRADDGSPDPQSIATALILGYAGVYSSFLLFAKRAGAKYGVSSRDILVELGRRKTVGGQEDMIEDLAINMARAASGTRAGRRHP